MIHIIAEAGTNHDGSLNKAKDLISLAAKAGADSVKFQHIKTWGLYLPGIYDYGNYDIKEVIKLRQKTEFSKEDLYELDKFAKLKSTLFTVSIFDEVGLSEIVNLNPPYIKIASCDLNNIRLLREVAKTKHKIILSSGQSTLKEIEFSLNEISKIRNLDNVVLLHCVSIYPLSTKDSNLGFITTLKKQFNLEIGFSDHTQDNTSSLVALGLGATWFEKHFTMNRSDTGLDHAYAMEENSLIKYISSLKEAYSSMQSNSNKLSFDEKLVMKRAQRGLYASRDMKVNEVIKDEDVLCVRPQNSISANKIDKFIGMKLKKKIKKHEPFTWDLII